METFWFFRLRFRRAYDSAYDSDIWFSLGHKHSYDSDYDSVSDSVASSLRAGSLVWVGDKEPRTGKPGEKNEARKSEPARELHVSDNYPIGVKQNVNNYDSALHARGDFHGGWSNFMDGATS